MDWKQLIADLIATDMTQVEIAAHCGVTQSSISEIARRDEYSPSYALGAALIELHKARVKGRKTAAMRG